jgi:hypothetical protein
MREIGRKLLNVDLLLEDLFLAIPENDGATWAALVPFQAAVRESMDKWANVIEETR